MSIAIIDVALIDINDTNTTDVVQSEPMYWNVATLIMFYLLRLFCCSISNEGGKCTKARFSPLSPPFLSTISDLADSHKCFTYASIPVDLDTTSQPDLPHHKCIFRLCSLSIMRPVRGAVLESIVVNVQVHDPYPIFAFEKSISGCCFLNFSSMSVFFWSSLVGRPISFCR